jgi:hypothetical protein
MMTFDPWPAVPFTASDLREAGITRSRLRRALADGVVLAVVRGVFLRSDVEQTVEIRAAAVSRVATPHHVITDRTAAWLLEVDAFTWSDHAGPLPIETCALRGRQPTHLTGVDCRTRDLLPGDITTIHGLLVTTPVRTGLDLGCCLRRREAYAALNALARRHHLTADDYLAHIARFRGRRGVRQLRPLLAVLEPRCESERESWMLLEILDASLPSPDPQYWITIDEVPVFRLDLAYPRHRVAVEYDGEEWHDLTDEQRRYDEMRRDWLERNDWTTVVVKRGDFTGAARDRWIEELRSALESSYTNRRW